MDFVVPMDHSEKMEENEKIDKCLDLDRELKKKMLWTMKVTVIPIVICTLRTLPAGMEKRLEELKIKGRIETIETTALLKSIRIVRRVMETWGDLLSKIPPANAG